MYHDWFESSFEYPDGGVVGAADFPNSPWGSVAGTPTIADGALAAVGESTTVASQGGEIARNGLRLRYQVVFTDMNNEVAVGVNADAAGRPTTGVFVSAADGTFTVGDGDTEVASERLGALDLGTALFVEVELDESRGTARLSRENYATIPGADVLAELTLDGLSAPNRGKYVAATLVPSGGTSPQVDDLTVSRCGTPPGDYDDVFVDTFERSTLGNADFPADSAWMEHGSTVVLTGGAARLIGFTLGPRARAARAIGNAEARLRAVVRFGTADAWPDVIWGVRGAPAVGDGELGFTLWNNGEEGHIILRAYGTAVETSFPGNPFEANTRYYVEVVADENFGVATVRTFGFGGPVFAATASDNVNSPAADEDEVGFSNSGSGTVYVNEMQLSQYVFGP